MKNEIIFVIGGIATGKNYYINNNYKKYFLIDYDKIAKKIYKLEYLTFNKINFTSNKITNVNNEVNKLLREKSFKNENIVHPTVGGSKDFLLDKIYLFKNFKIKIIYIENSLENNIKNYMKREKIKDLEYHEEKKIFNTYHNSKSTFEYMVKNKDKIFKNFDVEFKSLKSEQLLFNKDKKIENNIKTTSDFEFSY